MPINKTYIVKLYASEEKMAEMTIHVPTQKDAQHCANNFKSLVESIMRVNNRLCGWEHQPSKLRIVIETYKP